MGTDIAQEMQMALKYMQRCLHIEEKYTVTPLFMYAEKMYKAGSTLTWGGSEEALPHPE